MAEAQPEKSKGGYAYGSRKLQLSYSAEEGTLCLYSGHSIGRFSSSSMRFDSHAACVRCVAAAREGRLSFDIDRLLKKERKRALKFWSQVDIGAPDDCWEWQGYKSPGTGMPQFAWRRPGISSSTQHHPQRVLCGTPGETLASLVLKALAVTSTAVIRSTLFHRILGYL